MSIWIQVTEAAEEQLKQRLRSADGGIIKLVHDTEGCGCAVNGVPAIWIAPQADADDVQLQSNAPLDIYMNRHHMVFFDEKLNLDVSGTGGFYKLSSAQQIYSTHVACKDRRDNK
ncbi:iron-sulfur cluster biosynthesis family protein [Paenibacillaceae sp. P-4]|uniref:iron-sulfur cluster biosynthesis family protein n=1 Tax=Paenibacillaceae bacterium P-4 TaxID=3160969 RepID=UPI0032E81534